MVRSFRVLRVTPRSIHPASCKYARKTMSFALSIAERSTLQRRLSVGRKRPGAFLFRRYRQSTERDRPSRWMPSPTPPRRFWSRNSPHEDGSGICSTGPLSATSKTIRSSPPPSGTWQGWYRNIYVSHLRGCSRNARGDATRVRHRKSLFAGTGCESARGREVLAFHFRTLEPASRYMADLAVE